MVSLIKLNKRVDNKIDVVKKFIVIYCEVNDISLSKTEVLVLAYFILYGISDKTMDLIFNSKITNGASFKNILSKLRKNGFIRKNNKGDVLNEEFKIEFEQSMVGLLIKVYA